MAENFENLDNILCDWAKEKVPKILVEALNKYEKQEDKAIPFLENDSEKYSSCLNWQSSETTPSTKMVSASREPLLYLEFNKPNEQNVYEINLFEKFNFSLSQNNC